MTMNIKILFFGDVIGKLGRRAIAKVLPALKKKYKPDLVIANVENIAHGAGITKTTLEEIKSAGVEFFTSGNHVFDKSEVLQILADPSVPLLRPANYLPGTPGQGYRVIQLGKHKILVINLMGRVFMRENLDCPFRTADNILSQFKNEKLSAIIVDFHAETTSEKIALSWYLNGRVSLVVGTHSHVPTADAKISDQGTAMLSDAGMNGGRDTVIGANKEAVIEYFLTQLPAHFDYPESGVATTNALFTEIDPRTAQAKKVELIQTEINIQ